MRPRPPQHDTPEILMLSFEIQAIARRNDLPGFDLSLESAGKEPSLRMSRRTADRPGQGAEARSKAAARAPAQSTQLRSMPLFDVLSDETLERVRRDFPGWDVYALKAEFDAWLADDIGRQPDNYQVAFWGFVRRYETHAKPNSARSRRS